MVGSTATTSAFQLNYSFQEYLEFEARARTKHEFVSGVIIAMAGGSLERSALISAINAALSVGLQGRPCRVFDSNARVRMVETGNAYYPDTSVVCGRVETHPEDDHSLTNPVLIVEVLSPSTAEYDQGVKFEDYRRVPSLAHVVFVHPGSPRVDVWSREQGDWRCVRHGAGQHAQLSALDLELSVDEIYRDPLSPEA